MWQWIELVWQRLTSHPWLFRGIELLLANFIIGLIFYLWYFVITKQISTKGLSYKGVYSEGDFISDTILEVLDFILTISSWWFWLGLHLLFSWTEKFWEIEVKLGKKELEQKHNIKILIASPKDPRGTERRLMITCPKCKTQYSYYGYRRCTSCSYEISFTSEERDTLGKYHSHFPTELPITT